MTMQAATQNETPTATAAAAVSVRGVSMVYPGPVQALQDVDLEFQAGKLTTLLGPSGCGKTTLLKIIAGLIRPASGTVLVNSRPVDGPGPERAFVGFERKYPHELSIGMRQRVGLARALAVKADVLLLDEPFSAIDEQTRRKFQEDLLRLVAMERRTFVFVTHSIEEAVYLSDRIALLSPRPGRVWKIIEPRMSRTLSPDQIRREPGYLDTVEAIWQSLKDYVE